MDQGINNKPTTNGHNIEIMCAHKQGLIYVVPSESNWVCSKETIHAHAVAGFFDDINQLNDPRIEAITQKWGIYYRNTKDLPAEA
jgi:hypothetical protein